MTDLSRSEIKITRIEISAYTIPTECPESKLGLDARFWSQEVAACHGSFGFKQEHNDILSQLENRFSSQKVRETSTATLVMADGFSCREQIFQTTGRQGIHMVEVMQKALSQQ